LGVLPEAFLPQIWGGFLWDGTNIRLGIWVGLTSKGLGIPETLILREGIRRVFRPLRKDLVYYSPGGLKAFIRIGFFQHFLPNLGILKGGEITPTKFP